MRAFCGAACAHVVDDALDVDLAYGGQAIGEKDDDGGAVSSAWTVLPAARG